MRGKEFLKNNFIINDVYIFINIRNKELMSGGDAGV